MKKPQPGETVKLEDGHGKMERRDGDGDCDGDCKASTHHEHLINTTGPVH